MTTLTTPDNLVKWTTSDPASIIAQNNQLADSVQAALAVRALKSYTWADKSERVAQTGMAAGHRGYQEDIQVNWQYNGTVWQPDINTPFASRGDFATEISPSSIDYNGTLFSAPGDNNGGLAILWQVYTDGITGYYNPINSGLVPIVPSLASAVSGVSVLPNGAIQLTSVSASFILDGAFPVYFTDFHIKFKFTHGSSVAPPSLRLTKISSPSSAAVYDTVRVGTLNSAASNDQSLATTSHLMSLSSGAGTIRTVGTLDIYDPNVSTLPTFMLQHTVGTANPMTVSTATSIGSRATQHRTLDSYDGFQVIPAGAITGYIKIYGYNELGPGV